MQNQGEKNLPVESDVNNKDLVEIRFYNETLQRFIESYEDKAAEESDEQWLASRYKEEFSEWSKEEAETNAYESIDGIKTFETNHAELNEAIDKGQSKEVWFANKLAESAQGVPVADFGRYLSEVDNTLAMANEQMQRTILTQGGTVSANPNLDGFIAEQELVNTFNGRAALSESHYRAEVKVPGPGETYGKNSFDVVIRDTRNGNQIVHQYQIKYGKDAASTIRMLRESGEVTKYSNQRIVVPPEQVEEVQKAFPGKTVTSELGGTDKVSIKSDKLTKADAKQLQIEAQQQGKLPHKDWNDFSTQELSLKIGKETVLAGMQALTLSAGFNLASQLVKNGEIKGSELVKTSLKSGADSAVKCAAAGALKVASEKGMISMLPKGTPAGLIAGIAAVGIENVKIFSAAAEGKITAYEAIDRSTRTTVSMSAGLYAAGNGAIIGASVLSWIPVVGQAVGSIVGGTIGYLAGSTVGSAVHSVAKTIARGTVTVVKSAYNSLKSGFSKVTSWIFG